MKVQNTVEDQQVRRITNIRWMNVGQGRLQETCHELQYGSAGVVT